MAGEANGKLDRLGRLQEDLTDQLASIEEDWEETSNSAKWSQIDVIREKKSIARMVRDSRSWRHEAMCKVKEFWAGEIQWERNNTPATLWYQEWEKHTATEDIQHSQRTMRQTSRQHI